jgi:signal transduction histidine kinase
MVQEIHRGKADKWIGIHSIMDYSKEINKFVKMGTTSSNHLLALIEDILDLSKIESGIFSINMSEFVVKPMVEEVVQMFEYQCKQKRIELIWEFDERLNFVVVSSDRGRIKQVLINLVANSYKFTQAGSISIQVRLIDFYNKKFIQFVVKDTGIGIKKEDHSKLFTLFGKLFQKDDINLNGWGIGLTVSKKCIEALNGFINLKSKYSEGTTVQFMIPFIEVNQSELLRTLKSESDRIDELEIIMEMPPWKPKIF